MAIKDDSIKKNISQNITRCRERSGLSQKELAMRLNITPSRVSNWEQGANCPTIDMLFEVCNILGVSINDIYGVYPDSNMKLTYDEKQNIEKYRFISQNSQAGKETVDYVLNKQYEIAEQIKLTDERITKLKSEPATIIEFQSNSETPSRILQYFHSVSAGTGQVIFDDVYSERVVIPDIPEYGRVSYAVKVSGHSMEPLYYDGDMLLIEPTCEANVGEIGIFIVGNEAFVKKLGDGELISLNKGYDNIPLTLDSKCMGRVVDKFVLD